MDIDKLREFLIASNKAGYASGGELVATKQSDRSKTIIFEQGDFSSHDNYFGGEPFGGRLVVFYKNEPVWMTVYYGAMDLAVETFLDVYGFLRKALSNPPSEMPIRGPESLAEGDFRYENKWQGNLKQFSGEEHIVKNGKQIFCTKYLGGFIDVRKE